ncbi:classical arabinogalactan protein 9-like [Miscanthus floridulus]|uniref:classical arabinogalactan protein 9-like n=1 Tax=Miscanthus floridulus TaxID=154761 RepID=UPI00345AD51B
MSRNKKSGIPREQKNSRPPPPHTAGHCASAPARASAHRWPPRLRPGPRLRTPPATAPPARPAPPHTAGHRASARPVPPHTAGHRASPCDGPWAGRHLWAASPRRPQRRRGAPRRRPPPPPSHLPRLRTPSAATSPAGGHCIREEEEARHGHRPCPASTARPASTAHASPLGSHLPHLRALQGTPPPSAATAPAGGHCRREEEEAGEKRGGG